MTNRWRFGLLASVLVLSACVSVPQKTETPPPPPAPPVQVSRYGALVRLNPNEIPAFTDDIDTSSLRSAALESLSYFERQPGEGLFILGSDTYTVRDLKESMSTLIGLLETSSTPQEWLLEVSKEFAVYQSIGVDPRRSVTFSSYYEPTISAREREDKTYRFPLYARPSDLVDVDVSLFDPSYTGMRVAGRREGRALVPYLTRGDIDAHHALRGQGLEVAWAKNPMEVLDLQIEGSGWLDFGHGRLVRVRYDGDNGRRYRSVGQYMISTGRIPAKKFTRDAFLKYMAKHPEKRQEFLNVNERYIFFRLDTSSASARAYGNIDVPLTPWRSIATDPKLFPKGALAWIQVPKSAAGPVGRFMLNQDEGGAIQGPGRVDVFAGHGADSKQFATHFWNPGNLYFLVRKKPSS